MLLFAVCFLRVPLGNPARFVHPCTWKQADGLKSRQILGPLVNIEFLLEIHTSAP